MTENGKSKAIVLMLLLMIATILSPYIMYKADIYILSGLYIPAIGVVIIMFFIQFGLWIVAILKSWSFWINGKINEAAIWSFISLGISLFMILLDLASF